MPKEYFDITTQRQVRAGFWECNPQATRERNRDGDYQTDTRVAFVDYVDSLREDGVISEALASRVTLREKSKWPFPTSSATTWRRDAYRLTEAALNLAALPLMFGPEVNRAAAQYIRDQATRNEPAQAAMLEAVATYLETAAED